MECKNEAMIKRAAPFSPIQVDAKKSQNAAFLEQEPSTAVIIIADGAEETNAAATKITDGQENATPPIKDWRADIKCPICGDLCKNVRALRAHLKKHTPLHTCDLCDASFISFQSVVHHIRNHLGIRPYRCPACDKQFTTGGGLRTHSKMHPGSQLPSCYSCTICSLHFDSPASLDEHLYIEHANIPAHSCCLCDERFFTFLDLYDHERTHLKAKPPEHNSYAKTCVSIDRVRTRETVHTCNVCNTQFLAATELIDHMKEHLPGWWGRNLGSFASLTCNDCQRRFGSRIELSEHLKNSSRNIRWGRQCRICNHEFLTHCKLTEHLYPDGLQVSRACDLCKDWYAYPCALEIHREKHFGEGQALETPQQKPHQDDILLDLVEIKAETCDDFEEFQFIDKKATPHDQIA